MISVEEAQNIVVNEIPAGPVVKVSLKEARGRVVAKDVASPVDSPPFHSAAMDGFAIRHEETLGASPHSPAKLRVVGLVAAGDPADRPLVHGEAAWVMTGAMVPCGATAVIPQEEVLQDSDGVILVSNPVEQSRHIRFRGEEISAGGLALSRNSPVTAGTAGFLASLGVLEIPVFAPPKVFIFPTGSELVRHPSELGGGKIMESNSHALSAALSDLQITPRVVAPVPDIPKVIHAMLDVELEGHDFLLITGGISVGAFDYVKEILAKLKVKPCFWQVAQKPGKPLYFGRRNGTFVFGLPGNPSSSMVCFYEYVRPALLKWMGYEDCFLRKGAATLLSPFSKKEGRVHFVRGRAFFREEECFVEVLEGQESHKMQSFAKANCLLFVSAAERELKEGSRVTIHWLP